MYGGRATQVTGYKSPKSHREAAARPRASLSTIDNVSAVISSKLK